MIKCTSCGHGIQLVGDIWVHVGGKRRHPAVPPKGIKKVITLSEDAITFRTDMNEDCWPVGLEWQCPDCGRKVVWAEGMWWKLECDCRHWTWEMKIKGELR